MRIKNLLPWGSDRRSVPVRREEYDPFEVFQRDMNDLFENFFRGIQREPLALRGGAFSPRVDVLENDEEIRVTAELPGMDEKDIELSLSRDALTLKGEKKEGKEDVGKNYYRMERSYGSFNQIIPLPVEIDTEKVEAHFKKGVLTVKLPKTARAIKEGSKKVPISS